MTDDITVGVLSLHNSKESKAILNAAAALGFDTEWLRRETLAIDIDDGTATLEPDVDVVINRILLSKAEQPADALGLAETVARLRPMLNLPTATMTAVHKVATATALAEADVPVPDAFFALSADRLNADRARYGDEAVYKTAIGTHGGGTWKLSLDDPVNPTVGDRQAFIQRFVDHDAERHSDRRVYVVAGEVVGAMNRYAPEGDWRTNVALGGDVEDATDSLPDGVADIALRATAAVGLDYAGVDIIEGTDGHYVLEVNPTAGFKGLFRAGGHSPAPYIVRQAVERVGGTVTDEEVAQLSTRLDDSRPACAPRRPAEPVEPGVVGYIEEVTALGTRGRKRVLAKSDTGADRTSIDASLAAEIGTGPIKEVIRVKSGTSATARSRPVVDLVIALDGRQHTVTASVEDRTHMEYPLLLGRDILEHYHVDVQRRVDEDPEVSAE